MHRGRAVGRGNKEGRGGDNVCFPTKPARLLPRFITLHVCRIRCAAMCLFEMHTWSQSCAHTSHLLQLPFMCDDFSLECRDKSR